MQTIFITSFHVLISRNIIASPMMDALLERPDIRVVLLVPEKKRDFFVSEFSRPRLIIEGVERLLNRRDMFLRYLALAVLKTHSLAIKRKTEMAGSGAWLVGLIGNRAWAHAIIRRLDQWLTPRGRFGSLVDHYRPSLIFSTDVQNENDVRMMREARDRGMAIIGMVRSWDNLTGKGLIRIMPDILVVNNEIVKTEAIRLHGIPEEKIRVAGIPHYDRYIAGAVHSREEFSKLIGLNSKKRFIVYTPTGDRYLAENRIDQEIIQLIARFLPTSHELLVRLPPADSVTLADFNVPVNVVIHRPGRQMARNPNLFRLNELTREDDEILRDTLAYCDLVVAGPSTIIIDAAVFDKPIILVAFDGVEHPGYYSSVRRYYDYDHWRPVFESGGVRLAERREELEAWIKKYLAVPGLDREGRAKMVREQCWKLDGHSSERVVKILLERLSWSLSKRL